MARKNPAVGCIFVMFSFAFIFIFSSRTPFMFFSLFPMVFFFIIIFAVIISASSRRQRENRINELNSQTQEHNPFKSVDPNQNKVQIQNKTTESYTYPKVRFCHFCGTQLEQDALFCHGCGIKIER